MRAEQQYIDLFSQCEAMICQHSAEVLNAPRAQAFADFEKLGFPTRKQEKYKYTDVSKLFEPDYGLNLNRLDIPVNPYEVFKCDVPNMSTALYFVVNDAFYRKVLPKAQLPEGVLLGSLKELSEQYPALVKQYYGKLADTSKDGVTAFNTTFAQDGFMLYVPKGVVVDKPIQLVNILRADVNFMVNRRVLVVLEESAQARLLICDHAMDNVNFLSTQVIEVFAKENAIFDLYELEETHTSTVRFSNLYVNQEADSNVLLNGMTLHNGTTRNTTEVTLAGRGAEINLCGMVIADKNEQVDNHTFIDHKVADCTSNELFKYVLDDQATGAFAGKVLVREGAQHTNSQQTNRNLCATRDAHMYTQPQLEIYADDVKCSHGATVGQLDENALFYMQQRGISLKEARLLLMFAFVNELSKIFTKMGIDTQDVLEAASTKWNFLPFKPGLVGGHCIGVDPYYLAQCAQRHGYNPEIILAGRRMNDGMGEYVANEVVKLMLKKGIQVLGANILILGFTFKENCPDVRNTKVIDIYNALREYNVNITIYDPWANPAIVEHEYGIKVTNQLPMKKYDTAILAVAHKEFTELDILSMLNDNHIIYDVKGFLDKQIVNGRL